MTPGVAMILHSEMDLGQIHGCLVIISKIGHERQCCSPRVLDKLDLFGL